MISAGHFCAENSWDSWDLRDENVTGEPWQSEHFDPSIGVRGVETTEGLSAAFVKSSELVVCL